MFRRIAYIFVVYFALTAVSAATPVDSSATEDADRLLIYLIDLDSRSGTVDKCVSGMFSGYSISPAINACFGSGFSELQWDEVVAQSGKYLGLRGGGLCAGQFWGADANNGCQARTLDDIMYYDAMKASLKNHWDAGGLVQLHAMWVWVDAAGVIRNKGDRDGLSDGEVVQMRTEGTVANTRWKEILDKAADVLQYFEDHGVVIILRPFNEPGRSSSKWWNAVSAFEYGAQWRYLVGYFRDTKELHNILYLFDGRDDDSRYPGAEWVDLLGQTWALQGPDVQPDCPTTAPMDRSAQPWVFAEFNRKTNDLDYNCVLDVMKEGQRGAYFMAWNNGWNPVGDETGLEGPGTYYSPSFNALVNDPYVINRDEIDFPRSGKVEAESYWAHSGTDILETGSASGGQFVGSYDSGEWTEYRVTVPSDGVYEIVFRVASRIVGTRFELREGQRVLATVEVGDTGGWERWVTVTESVPLTSGETLWRIAAVGASFPNLDYFLIRREDSVAGPLDVVTVSPKTLTRGQQATLSLTGTGFQAGATVRVCRGDAVAIDAVGFVGSRELQATVSVSADARIGACGVSVTNPDGEYDRLTSAVTLEEGRAESLDLTGVSTDRLTVATSALLTLSGTGFQPGATVRVCRDGRVTINGVSFVNSSTLDVSLSVRSDASTGWCNVRVVNPDGAADVLREAVTIVGPFDT